MRFSTKLFLGASAIVLVATGTTVVGVRTLLRGEIEERFIADLEREARVVAEGLANRPANLNDVADRFGALLERRVTFIDSTGVVVGDSDFDDDSILLLENHLSRPEVQQALAEGRGVHRRLSASTNRVELKVAIAHWPAVVRISAVANQADELIRVATFGALIAGLTSLLLSTILAAIVTRSVSRPVHELALASQAVASGTTPTYPASSTREIRELSTSFRSMHEQLNDRVQTMERQRTETTTMLDAMVQGVLTTDEGGEVKVCNRAMRSMLGYGPDDVLPGVLDLFHHRGARDVVERALQGETVSAAEISFQSGTAHLMTALKLPDGGLMLGLLDVSEIRRLENVRRDFVGNVSHELKTPLTSILGYSATLLDHPPDPETSTTFLSTIHRNAKRMQHLVDDLLSLARVESGAWEPRPEEVDMLAIVNESWSTVADRAKDKGVFFDVAVDVPEGRTVRTDRAALQQVLTNLFDNALRHSYSGATIRCAVTASPTETVVSVSDTGTGIGAEHLPRVFERFYRADPGRSREDGGTGLGLSIVKHLVETQGGRIDLKSVLNKGTTVAIHLPASDPNTTSQ